MKKFFLLLISCALFSCRQTTAMNLQGAILSKNLAQIQALLNNPRIDINQADYWENTPLHYAAWLGNKEIMHLLLERGAEVNKQNYHGMTPLHLAAAENHESTAHILIEYKADTKLRTSNFLTSYIKGMLAAQSFGHFCEALTFSDHVWEYSNLAPLDIAQLRNNTKTARLLEAWIMIEAGKQTLASALHPRLGAHSPAHMLSQPLLQQISQYLQP